MSASRNRCRPYFVVATVCLFLQATVSSPVAAQSCLTLASQPNSWWMGDGDASDSIGGRHATLHAGATFAAGRVAQAFAFDGVDDYASVDHDTALDVGSSDWGFHVWLNFDDLTGAQVVLEKYVASASPTGWSLMKTEDQRLRLLLPGGQLETAPQSFVAGTWYLVSVGRTNATVAIMVNGVVQVFTAAYSGNLDSTSSLKLGHRGGPADTPGSTDSSGMYFRGRLDEVLFKVGPDTEGGLAGVQALFAAGGAGVCSPSPACGNGRPESGEACDDGNAVSADGCENDCTSSCGNGVVAGSEACDDGNQVETDACRNDCTVASCGDAVKHIGVEECDDGNLVDDDDCRNDCTLPSCGDGSVQGPYEECDDSNAVASDGCDNDCTVSLCGNGQVAGGEECDDGNLVDDDGCDHNCTTTRCGNAVPAGSEQCDDGDLADGDGCDSNCLPTGCPNSIVTAGETCDDGNLEDGDGCDRNCRPSGCGSGIRVLGEICDDGNTSTEDGCESDCTLTDGILDPTFDGDGAIVGDLAQPWRAVAIDLQSDGSVVAAYTDNGVTPRTFTLTRHAPNGALDPSFGTAGLVRTTIGVNDAEVRTMFVLPDDRIVVLGMADAGAGPRIVMARYLADGSADTSLGGTGVVMPPHFPVGRRVFAAVPGPAGSVVLIGDGGSGVMLAKLDAAGAADPSFGGDGIVIDSRTVLQGWDPVVAVQDDGSVVAVAAPNDAYGESDDLLVLRYLPDGSIDASFGTAGRTRLSFDSEDPVQVALQEDGRIVIGGSYLLRLGQGVERRIAATARLTTTGALDATYSGDGIATIDHGSNDAHYVNAMAIDPATGVVTVAGFMDIGWGWTNLSDKDIGLARFLPDGSPDTGLAGTGWLRWSLGHEADRALDLLVQPDGKTVVAIETTDAAAETRFALARLLVGTCGDGRAQTRLGEQCDDRNLTDGDGCQSDCTLTPLVAPVDPGGTVTTDPLGVGATPAAPLQTAVTSPNGGQVQIGAPPNAVEPDGFEVIGVQLQIEAPAATVEQPLSITLTIDSSAIPLGVTGDQLDIVRNGVLVQACVGPAGQASPNPCVESRVVLSDGDVQITVLTSDASLWSFVLRGLQAAEQNCVLGIGKAVANVAKAQGKLNATCLKNAAGGEVADLETCLAADPGAKVASKMLDVSTFADEQCVPAPVFGFSDAVTSSTAPRDAVIGLVAAALGEDADPAIALDRAGAKCQASVLKQTQKIYDTATKLYLSCVKNSVAADAAAVVTSGAGLSACLGSAAADTKHAKGIAKLAKALAKSCTGDVGSLLAGDCADSFDRSQCLASGAACAVCRTFDAVHAIGVDCDVFDNTAADGSCE